MYGSVLENKVESKVDLNIFVYLIQNCHLVAHLVLLHTMSHTKRQIKRRSTISFSNLWIGDISIQSRVLSLDFHQFNSRLNLLNWILTLCKLFNVSTSGIVKLKLSTDRICTHYLKQKISSKLGLFLSKFQISSPVWR